MHLVCLGVTRRILNYFLKGPLRTDRSGSRLSIAVIKSISEHLCQFAAYMRREFARKPRALAYLDRWKATEFRQFLLYTAPLVLQRHISPEVFDHFILSSTAIRFLACPQFAQKYADCHG